MEKDILEGMYLPIEKARTIYCDEAKAEIKELKERVKEDLKIIGHLKTFVDAEVFELIGLDKDILKECEQLLKQTDN